VVAIASCQFAFALFLVLAYVLGKVLILMSAWLRFLLRSFR